MCESIASLHATSSDPGSDGLQRASNPGADLELPAVRMCLLIEAAVPAVIVADRRVQIVRSVGLDWFVELLAVVAGATRSSSPGATRLA